MNTYVHRFPSHTRHTRDRGGDDGNGKRTRRSYLLHFALQMHQSGSKHADMIVRCLIGCVLLVTGTINAFGLVKESSSALRRIHHPIIPSWSRAFAPTHIAVGYPRRFACSIFLRDRSNSSQDYRDVEEYVEDSPSSQLPLEIAEENDDGHVTASPVPLPFTRNEEWLEDATRDVYALPVGSLTADDMESISSLMVAWARRRSTQAAVTVEQLLKRVIDDMHANNKAVHVNTKMYTHVSVNGWI